MPLFHAGALDPRGHDKSLPAPQTLPAHVGLCWVSLLGTPAWSCLLTSPGCSVLAFFTCHPGASSPPHSRCQQGAPRCGRVVTYQPAQMVLFLDLCFSSEAALRDGGTPGLWMTHLAVPALSSRGCPSGESWATLAGSEGCSFPLESDLEVGRGHPCEPGPGWGCSSAGEGVLFQAPRRPQRSLQWRVWARSRTSGFCERPDPALCLSAHRRLLVEP